VAPSSRDAWPRNEDGAPGPWWGHGGLTVRSGRLQIAGRDAEAVAREHGTPLYAYDVMRIGEQIESLLDAAWP
jgi:hypothetical protein